MEYDVTKSIKKLVNNIKQDKGVIAILIFGSYEKKKEYARDIDLCIMLDKKYSDYAMTKKMLKYLRHAPDKFDIQIFQFLPLYIRINILREGRILHSKNTKKVYDIAYETIKEYRLFEPHYKRYIEVVA